MALTPIEQVRLLIGDKDPNDKGLTDTEIEHFLDGNGGDITLAALDSARALSRYYATKAAFLMTGRMSVSYAQRSQEYRKVIAEIEQSLALGTPYIGGISQAELDASKEDTDLVQPAFTRDLHRYEEPEPNGTWD